MHSTYSNYLGSLTNLIDSLSRFLRMCKFESWISRLVVMLLLYLPSYVKKFNVDVKML